MGTLRRSLCKTPPDFENVDYPEHVMKLDKALCGLKHELKTWYERLSGFLLSHGFKREKIDNTLCLKSRDKNLLIV